MNRIVLSALALTSIFATVSHSEALAQLKPFERGSWQHILTFHRGRPTLIHFWGVTCGPCKVELPVLGQFMKKHQEIDVVTISADLVPNGSEAAAAMLKAANLDTAEGWIFSGYTERLRFEVDPTWQGDIPRTILISSDGKTKTIEGSVDDADLEMWAAQMSASK